MTDVLDTSTVTLPDDDDPTAVLDERVLPLGIDDRNLADRISIPLNDKGKPIDSDDSLLAVFEAGNEFDHWFDRDWRQARVDEELRTFSAKCWIDGVRVIPAEAEAEKRRQILEAHKEATDAAAARFKGAKSVSGRMLHEERADVIRPRTHAETVPPAQFIAAHSVDLQEQAIVAEWFRTWTLEELVAEYQRTPDQLNRALVKALETGRRPARTDEGDAMAAVRLQRLIRERQAARIPAELRKRFARLKLFAASHQRDAKIVLTNNRRIK